MVVFRREIVICFMIFIQEMTIVFICIPQGDVYDLQLNGCVP